MTRYVLKVQFDRLHSEDDEVLTDDDKAIGSVTLFSQLKKEIEDVDLPIDLAKATLDKFLDGAAGDIGEDAAGPGHDGVDSEDDYRIVACLPVEFPEGTDVPAAMRLFVARTQEACDEGMAGFFVVVGVTTPDESFEVRTSQSGGEAFFVLTVGDESFSIFNNEHPVPGDDHLQQVGWHFQSYSFDEGPIGPYATFDEAVESARTLRSEQAPSA